MTEHPKGEARPVIPRPPFCPDPKGCRPLIWPLTDSDNRRMDNPGFAVHCFGKMAKPLVWTFGGIEHHEDLRCCDYSPLKGVVMWLENRADWDALAYCYRHAVDALDREATS